MIDENLKVWLIEVNTSPSMERSTKTTMSLVTNVLTDLPKVIIDFAEDDEVDEIRMMWDNNISTLKQAIGG